MSVLTYEITTDYREAARAMPVEEAKETLREVLREARGDSPSRNDTPLEGIEVTDDYFEVTGICYDEAGHAVGRRSLKATYNQLQPSAFQVRDGIHPTAYFVKLMGKHELSTVAAWSEYPNLLNESLWLSHPDDVQALFEALACLKANSSSN